MDIHNDTTVCISTKITYKNPKHEAMEYSPFLEMMKWQFILSFPWMQLTIDVNGSSVYSGHVPKSILSLYHTVNKVYTCCKKQGIPIKTDKN